MSLSNEQILIDYLDNRLEGDARLEAELLIRDDAAAAQELEYLRFSVDLIREAAITEQVVAVRTTFNAGAKIVSMPEKKGSAVVRSFSKGLMRVAATVLLLLGMASVYKYSITNVSSVYDQNFTSFDLNTSRGINNDGEIEKAYRNKNWVAVETTAAELKDKTPKSWFLSGMAAMELKNFDKAIIDFNEVANLNKNTTSPYYQDEAEFYLALSYLHANNAPAGIAILKKIRNDKGHLFYKKASSISALDLKLLELH